MEKRKRNRRKSTTEQFEEMVKFVTLHSCLIDPKISTSFITNSQKEKLWDELRHKLNSIDFAPKKNVSQWKRVWNDLKNQVKDKLAEVDKKRQKGVRERINNPIYRKVAKLLDKYCLIEQQDLSTYFVTEQEEDVFIKIEESIDCHPSEIESNTIQPIVISSKSLRTQSMEPIVVSSRSLRTQPTEPIVVLSKSLTTQPTVPIIVSSKSLSLLKPVVSSKSLATQPTETASQNLGSKFFLVKYKGASENGNPVSEDLNPYVQTVNSNEDCQSLENSDNSTMPAFKKKKPVAEDTHLRNLVEAKKDKSNSLLAIADAISLSNENQEKLLKIEEERNRLIQQRNIIESERNDLFKSLFEHLKSKKIL